MNLGYGTNAWADSRRASSSVSQVNYSELSKVPRTWKQKKRKKEGKKNSLFPKVTSVAQIMFIKVYYIHSKGKLNF